MEKKTWSTHPIFCILFLYFLSSKMVEAQNIPIRVVVVLEMDDYGGMALNCISMALDDFYSTRDHYKTRLLLTNRDSKGDVLGAATTALDLMKNVEVQAIIGPMFSGLGSFLISLGQKSRVPIVTLSATSPSLTSTNDSSRVEALGAVVKAFGWREVVPIYADNEFGKGILPYSNDSPRQKRISMNTYSAIESIVGVIGVKPYVPPKTKELDDFTMRYKRRNNTRGRVRYLDIFGLHAYDSAIAAEKANLGNPKYQEANLIQDISNITLKGQLQSPRYEIVEMAGTGALCIGYWTKDRNFTRVKSNLGLTKWSGDVSFSPNGLVTPRYGKTLSVRVSVKPGFEFVRDTWNFYNSTKVEGYRIDVFNAVMASLPIGFLVWALEHQINKYFRHPFWHQLGMTMWFAFSAFIFSLRETVVQTRPSL